ncbi:MAG: SMC-Scp complex subunit ScpB [Patescibacteria group bacterium]|jgi:segregation and condensation protein B|nr:SMC-Scp complex subunit ScpB [Patescibacteria group bacterium]
MEKDVKKNLESLLFVAEKPVSVKELANVTSFMVSEVQTALNELEKEYENRGIRLIRKGEYFSIVTAPECGEIICKYLNEELRHDLSQAALETLAVITYKQPLTRVEIEEIRGVNSDQTLRSLLVRGLICEIGRKETIGRPILYGTTMEFIQYFGLLKEDELPRFDELKLFREEDEAS